MKIFNFIEKFKKENNKKTCLSIYQKAKKARPNSDENDLLKLVLLTKPPFDYQHDKVIDGLIEMSKDINSLSDLIFSQGKPSSILWQHRKRNLKYSNLKNRNKIFFNEFWKL